MLTGDLKGYLSSANNDIHIAYQSNGVARVSYMNNFICGLNNDFVPQRTVKDKDGRILARGISEVADILYKRRLINSSWYEKLKQLG